MKKRKRLRPSSFQIIILGFAAVIFFGALLLMLPISAKDREMTPFLDCLFTATSATCVTGLVVVDTATHWSLFGQTVILALIQIGGMGVITVALALSLLSGRKIGIRERSTMQEAISAHNVGGIVRYTGFIIRGVLIIELLGALAMMPVFCRDFGARGIWYAFFHSISAFCNAGFDLLGTEEAKFASLTAYSADPVINITVILLILIGGIGFLTWEDIWHNKWHISKYRLQTKAVLSVSAVIILLPALYFFIFEFGEYPLGERILLSLFQTVTPRTAGFNTAELGAVSDVGIFIMIVLMLIGGSSGSTAGGIKMTTVAVLVSCSVSVFRKRSGTELGRRRVSEETVRNALAIFFLYITLFLLGGSVISVSEGLPLLTCLYESASAVATVGLTLGITPTLSVLSRLILILLMYFGRVGALTLIFAALGGSASNSKLPIEKISVG